MLKDWLYVQLLVANVHFKYYYFFSRINLLI
mgnify:CR=1 FL=1